MLYLLVYLLQDFVIGLPFRGFWDVQHRLILVVLYSHQHQSTPTISSSVFIALLSLVSYLFVQ